MEAVRQLLCHLSESEVEGDVYARGKVVLQQDARIEGGIWSGIRVGVCDGGNVVIREDARIKGNVYTLGNVDPHHHYRITGVVHNVRSTLEWCAVAQGKGDVVSLIIK